MQLCLGKVRGDFGRRLGVMGFMCLLTWGAMSLAAFAQSIDSIVGFDIPAQPLGTALTTLAVQANLQIFFEQTPVAGLSAPAVQGSMTTEQALQKMLAGSSLTFKQNDDGTLVVLRKAKVAGNRPTHKTQAVAATAAPTLLAATPATAVQTALEREGPWIVRARATYTAPNNISDAFEVPSSPATDVPRNGARSNDRWAPELDAEYFFDSQWSSELALNYPQTHELLLQGAVAARPTARVGNFRLTPSFLTLKFNLLPEAVVRPYVGVGINVTAFSTQSASPFGLSKTTVGPAAQAGFDIRLDDHWSLNADAKWARSRPVVDYEGNSAGHMKLDPVLLGLGVGYRFGGKPAHTAPIAKAAPAPVLEPPPVDSDGDGVPDTLDRCPNTPKGVKVDARGCPLDSDNDGVPDYLDQCPGTPPGLKVDASGCEIEELVLTGVTFDTNSAHLTEESAVVLNKVVAVLRQRPNAHTEIHGYTDSRGSDAYNQGLSERRAAAVVQYLVEHGIAGPNLSARGFGKANPVAGNDTVEGRARNRRVTVEFSRPVPRS